MALGQSLGIVRGHKATSSGRVRLEANLPGQDQEERYS